MKDAATKLVAQKQAALEQKERELEACHEIWKGASKTDRPRIIKQMQKLIAERAAAEKEKAAAEAEGNCQRAT